MSRLFSFLFFMLLTCSLVWVMGSKWDALPPVGPFFDPFGGFWQNAEKEPSAIHADLKLPGLYEKVRVVYDDRLVPHIFAGNDSDLYFMQGYVTAQHRLWQMDMQVRAAAGRLAEVIGERLLNIDIEARRIGLKMGAERSLTFMNNDPKSKMILERYTAGVNAWIASLNPASLPLEYKLLDFRPEAWTPLKTALLLKYMANLLTGYENDFENTNALKLLGYKTFDQLFPNFPDTLLDPVIPAGTIFPPAAFRPDTLHAPPPGYTSQRYPFSRPEPDYGSNNWAVSGTRTASGKPILCNDPHLSLNLPGIWYEVQLHAPGMNVYGVSIPGAPCVISGFNDSIAWGITNAAMDVRDWYTVEFRDASRQAYRYDDKWLHTEQVVETFYVRGKEPVYDTILQTIHGPVAYDRRYNKGVETVNMALRWTAHDAGNELRTFYLLNTGKNYSDYTEALNHYKCPGQNFVFASAGGDIAIRQQGRFVNRYKDQGRFVLDGTRSSTAWQGFIPDEHTPQVLNPARGWVSSANQHPTDEKYPYYYTGIYEYYRNRRINNRLAELTQVRTQDMMQLQNDNFNLCASECLPILLRHLDSGSLGSVEREALTELSGWNYYNDPEPAAPVYFELWWEYFRRQLWDEFDTPGRLLVMPGYFQTIRYLQRFPDSDFIDHKGTPETETLAGLCSSSFRQMLDEVKKWKNDHAGKEFSWAHYKNTTIIHLSRQAAFSVAGVHNGGNSGVVNATSSGKGPSWRMVVSPGSPGEAFGIYPGGQSGNPGSPYYSNFIEDWAKGKYYSLLLLKPDEKHSRILFVQQAAP